MGGFYLSIVIFTVFLIFGSYEIRVFQSCSYMSETLKQE